MEKRKAIKKKFDWKEALQPSFLKVLISSIPILTLIVFFTGICNKYLSDTIISRCIIDGIFIFIVIIFPLAIIETLFGDLGYNLHLKILISTIWALLLTVLIYIIISTIQKYRKK